MLRIISMAILNGHLHRPPVPHLVDLEKRATQIFEYAHDAIPAIYSSFSCVVLPRSLKEFRFL